jgi:hypothetical protein
LPIRRRVAARIAHQLAISDWPTEKLLSTARPH